MVLVSIRKTEGQLGFRFPHIRRGRNLIYVSAEVLYQTFEVLQSYQFLNANLGNYTGQEDLTLNRTIKYKHSI